MSAADCLAPCQVIKHAIIQHDIMMFNPTVLFLIGSQPVQVMTQHRKGNLFLELLFGDGLQLLDTEHHKLLPCPPPTPKLPKIFEFTLPLLLSRQLGDIKFNQIVSWYQY